MAKSLPPVSAKVIADAEKFVAEFRRAEQAAARGRTKIGVELDKIHRDVEKKFSFSGVGKSLLQGFGLGSGFAVFDTVIGQVTKAYEEHQQKLKTIDETWKSILDKSREYHRSLLAPADNVKEIEADLNKLYEKYQKLVTPKEVEFNVFTPGGGVVKAKGTPTWGGSDDQLKMAKLLQEIQAKGIELENARKKVDVEVKKTTEDVFAALEKRTAAQQRDLETAEKAAEQYRQLADPTHKYMQQLEEIDDLFWAGHLSAEAAAAAIDKVNIAMAEAGGRTIGQQEDLLRRVFGDADDLVKEANDAAKAAQEIGYAFESSFESAIVAGEKLSEVLKGLGDDLMRIAIRRGITDPLIGALFGDKSKGTKGLFGGFFADGGSPPVGRASVVGEHGPELFVPRTAGTVVPNHKLGGRGGDTYYIDARGADRTGLAHLEAQIRALNGSIEHRAVAAVADARRRGPSYS